jgi:hypothetical protein
MKKRIALVAGVLGLVIAAFAGVATKAAAADPGVCAFTTKNATMTLNADCSTSTTISVPNGVTLNGNGHTITAVDPTGGAFTGAVVMNGGSTMNVTNLTIHGASAAVENCRDYNGVAFMAAGGSVSNVTLDGIGIPLNTAGTGCNIGRAIIVRDAGTASQQTVKIENNVVSHYNKNGIDVRGNVAAKIDGNSVTTDASDLVARNGIVVGDGASAQVWSNTVSGNQYTPLGDWYGTGILAFNGATINLTKSNNVSHNDVNYDTTDGNVVGKNKVNP